MDGSNAQQNIEEKLKQVTTYAFVGAAGTGKSQRAQSVAAIVDADFIIDDGLVIFKGSIVCGKSAKSSSASGKKTMCSARLAIGPEPHAPGPILRAQNSPDSVITCAKSP